MESVAEPTRSFRTGRNMSGIMPIGVHGLIHQRTARDRPGVAARLAAGLGQNAYTREEFIWSDIQPTSRSSFSWATTDAWVKDCANAGLHIFGTLLKPPTWAVAGSTQAQAWTQPPATDIAIADYAEYCGRVAARYGPGGTFWAENPSMGYLPVVEFEIWNEPYKFAGWKYPDGSQRPADTELYGRIVTAAAAAIHATPGCKVFASVDTGTDNTGGLPSPQPFLIPFLEQPGVLGAIDGLSVHPYAYGYVPATYEPTGTPRAVSEVEWHKSWLYTSKLADCRAILAAHSKGSMPIWITEIGYPTHTVSAGTVLGSTQAKAEQQQAMRVEAVFQYLRRNYGLVQGLIFYTWQTMPWQADVPGSPNYSDSNPEHFFGLVHNDGWGGYGDGTTCTAKPAWDTLVAQCVNGLPI
ncbi:hypothetical protein AB6813_02145 [bacterium RCC_150]